MKVKINLLTWAKAEGEILGNLGMGKGEGSRRHKSCQTVILAYLNGNRRKGGGEGCEREQGQVKGSDITWLGKGRVAD